MSRGLGTLTIDMVAKTGGFVQGMDKAGRAAEDWRYRTERESRAAARAYQKNINLITAAAGAAALAIGVMAKKGVESISAQAAFARSLDTSFDSLTALSLAAKEHSLDGMEASLNRLNRRLGAAETGGGAAAKAVKSLGLDLKQLSKVGAAERLAIISDTIIESGASAQQTARHLQDLGFEQKNATDFFLQGGDAIRAYNSEVERLGLSVSDVEAEKLEAAAAAMGDFGNLTKAASQQFALALTPTIEAAGKAMEWFLEAAGPERLVEGFGLLGQASMVVATILVSRLAASAVKTTAAFTTANVAAARYQATLASMAGVSKATAVAIGVTATAARGATAAMALLGGPVGAVITAATALAFFATKSSGAESEAENLKTQIDELGKSYGKITNIEAAAKIHDVSRAINAQEEAVTKLKTQLETLEVRAKRFYRPDEVEQIDKYRFAIQEAEEQLAGLVEKQAKLQRTIDEGGSKELANDAAELSEEYIKLSKQLEEKILLTGLSSDAEKLAAKVSAGLVDGITETEGRLLVELQKKLDKKKEIIKAEKDAAQTAVQTQKNINDEISALERAYHVWGMNTDEIRLYNLEKKGATKSELEYAKALLSTIDAEKKKEANQGAYLSLLKELRTDEERLNDTLKERLDILAAIDGATEQDYERTAAGAFQDMPDFAGSSEEFGGELGEIGRMEAAREAQEEWYENQLEMLNEYREEYSELNAEWDAQEEQLKEAHSQRMMEIDAARHAVQFSAAESIFGDLSTLAKEFGGEQSALFKAMFIAEKAAALARSMVAIQVGIAQASALPFPANLAAIAQVTSATVGIVSTIKSVQLQGQAHDGIDEVPETGTWLLEKGERVTTAETSAKLDATLDQVNRGGGRGGGVVVNLYEDAEKAGQVEEDDEEDEEQKVINIFVSNLVNDGEAAGALENKYGLTTQGI